MVARARALRADDGSIYRRSDLETLDLPRAAFEFACSSPALHDVADLLWLKLQVLLGIEG